MARALVVYNATDDATRLAAEEIARGISGAGRIATTVADVDDLVADRVQAFDIVVLGSPASARGALRELRHLEEVLPLRILDRKMVSVFDAGPTGHTGAGARTLRETLQRVDPSLHLAAPGISVGVDPRSHELPEPELARCRQFGEHLVGLAVALGSA